MKAIIILALLVVLLTTLGCVKSADDADGMNLNEVEHLEIWSPAGANWDNDGETDGIEYHLQPRDSSGNIVKAAGTIEVQAWTTREQFIPGSFDTKLIKDKLIIQTEPIQLTRSSYAGNGSSGRVAYINDFIPTTYQMGWMEATLTVDGKEFVAIEKNVRLDMP